MVRPYLIHNCFNPTVTFQVWDTKKAKSCRCKLRVSADERDALLEDELIQPVIVGWNTLGEKSTPTYSETVFCFTLRAAKTPRVATIEEQHIENAYVNGYQWAIDRINEWGFLANEVLQSLIVPERPSPLDGHCLFLSSGDERTSVGVTVAKVPDAEI